MHQTVLSMAVPTNLQQQHKKHNNASISRSAISMNNSKFGDFVDYNYPIEL